MEAERVIRVLDPWNWVSGLGNDSLPIHSNLSILSGNFT